tara:strand:- start:318 stop:1205 length:888 start_codon:yes stop_codon:yes gene_type:complete
MSAQNTNNVAPAAEKKARKPTLSGKYSKFMEFGYSLVQSLRANDTLNDEGLEAAYSQLKLFEGVESQTEFYEQILVQSKETGKVMRKFITQRNKPPKAPKEKKPRKTKAKKEEAKVEVQEGEAPVAETKEKKARKPRAKKTTNVVQDTQNDVIGDIVAAANADPLVNVAEEKVAEATKEEKKKGGRKPKAKKEEGEVTPEAKVDEKAPGAPKKARKTKAKKEAVKTEVANTPPVNEEIVPADLEEELEEEQITTQEVIIGGTTYLMDDENNLYSIDTHDDIGRYNPETQKISKDL